MYATRVRVRLVGAVVIVCSGAVAAAQSAREGSGTSWLPDSSPMYAVHLQRGAWMLMAHENAFLQFLHESGRRGDDDVGSINWFMGMAQRNAGRGHIALRGMFSLEPWTIRGCGYPDLLASGEQCHGHAIHDRQHPHDFAMEIAAEYDAPLTGTTRWQIYGGPSAEPALGPVAYPHRVSAMPNPIAPIAHHWLDATHVSFGVVTGGVYGQRWKLETSAFNGREPDENRKDFDFGALDSVSGRAWFLPTTTVALQVSAGHLKGAEAGEGTDTRVDVNRITASATFHRLSAKSVSASTIGWGRNSEAGLGTNALLLETSVTLDDRHTWFGRLEVVQKTPHDLDLDLTAENLALSKIQGGYTRYVSAPGGLKAGLGATVSASIVPGDLRDAYGRRLNAGAGVFLTLRPAARAMGSGAGAGATMVMVQTAFDPAKLSCPAGFDPKTAASTSYQGRTYYFCSVEDRDMFLTNPAMSLSMRPPKQ
jgi:YHS domain-containing protein